MRQGSFRPAGTASFVFLVCLLTAEAAPTVTSFTPALGKPGTQVVISGSGFSTATQVKFDSAVADFSAASDNQIVTTVPGDATTGPIRVTNPSGLGNSSSNFAVAPRISELDPTRGAINTTVTIYGYNFVGTTNVLFNSKRASFGVTAATQIRATVPFGATNGPITIMTPAGVAVTTNNFLVIGPAPIIDGFTPGIGGPGTFVQITGVNFTNVTSVKFNGVADPTTTNASAPTQIQATVPANATTGPITVTTSAGTATSTNNFIVTRAPVITNFFPAIGKAGQTQVTIEGLNLGPTNNVTGISFAGASVSGWGFPAENQISVTVPPGAITGPIRVTNTVNVGVSSNDFIVTRAPIVTGFEPIAAAPGDQIRIDGINFTSVPSPGGVKFNGANSKSNTVTADTLLFAYVPNNATTGPLTVTNSFGAGSSTEDFTVIGNLPVISDFSPDSGARGTPVTINGKNFIGLVTVKFNGVVDPTTTTAPAPTQIRATVPGNATTGPITVTTSAGTSTNSNIFYVPPRLTGFTPTSGVVGTNVVINGANFTGATGVLFNTASANFSVNASNKLTTTVPTNATTGPLTVITPGGIIISTNTFRVLPNITSFSPTLGPVGTLVTILGTSFFDVTNVSFNNVNSANFTVVSSTEIRAEVPPTATTGPIRVSTPDGIAVSATNFLVTTRSDLVLTMSVSATLAKPGDPLTYRLVVTNRGPSIVTGVTLTDTLPDGVNFVSANSMAGPCPQSNGVVRCNIGVLTNNTGFTVTIVVVPPVEAVLNNTATISSVEGDLNPVDNTASVSTTVILDASRTLRIGLLPDRRNLVISWPFSVVQFTLQFRDSFAVANTWQTVTNVPVVIDARNTVTNDASGANGFFRLIKPPVAPIHSFP